MPIAFGVRFALENAVILGLTVAAGTGTVHAVSAGSELLLAADDCIEVELTLPTADSMVATVPRSRCGDLRLSIVGPPYRVPRDPGNYWPERQFRIPVVLENVGTRTFQAPLEMRVDSVTPVQRGRQLNARYSRGLFDVQLWRGSEMQQPWLFNRSGRTASRLRPGERSGVDTLIVSADPRTQSVRVWLNVASARPPQAYVQQEPRVSSDRAPVGRAIEQFIAAANLPKARATNVLLRLRNPELVIFDVSYGEPQDCPSGCFYFSMLGLAYNGTIGWLSSDDHPSKAFPVAATDTFLFSLAFQDALAARFGRWSNVEAAIYRLLLQQSDVPRSLLMRYIERVYANIDQQLVMALAQSPAVKRDSEMLTLLANLPDGGPPFLGARQAARLALQGLAPEIVRDTATSARTLFVVAQMVSDSALDDAIARHPNARSNPAILAILARAHPLVRAQMITAVRAPERVKRLLAAWLENRQAMADIENPGRSPLDDPEAGANSDVLSVLANYAGQELAWAASRRLPESALRRLEPDYVPIR